jgi:hypothetical protein
MPTVPKQTVLTEEMVASVLPYGEKKTSREILEELGLTKKINSFAVGGMLKGMSQDGLLHIDRGTNRANLWSRLREPVPTPPDDDKDQIRGVVIERVAIGGSDSGYYGTSQDKPSFVTLPKMPTLKSLEANT